MNQGRLWCVSSLVAEVGDPAVRHWRVVLRRLLIIRSFGALVGGLRLDGGNEPRGFVGVWKRWRLKSPVLPRPAVGHIPLAGQVEHTLQQHQYSMHRAAGVTLAGHAVQELGNPIASDLVDAEAAKRRQDMNACGYALANKGHDMRALQAYLGHCNIQHTVRYTEFSPARFKNFWQD